MTRTHSSENGGPPSRRASTPPENARQDAREVGRRRSGYGPGDRRRRPGAAGSARPARRRPEPLRRRPGRRFTAESPPSALRAIVDGWMFTLEEDSLTAGVAEDDAEALEAAVAELLERRLAEVGRSAPTFAASLRGYRAAVAAGDTAAAEGVLAWLGGQPHVAASAKRAAPSSPGPRPTLHLRPHTGGEATGRKMTRREFDAWYARNKDE
ncbi:BREX system ATP-binding domain-containing protein [Sphaerisporangium sp. NPDC005288]|uniref:BREX system ATP-binding domain-containing protein n=1 Tax=Sphaerisporangium sp. NPDC005288 TaxID=3155114 RepID=UPI0033A5FAD9